MTLRLYTRMENGLSTAMTPYGPDVCSDFICNFIAKQKKEAFLVYYPMILPHDPFVPTPNSNDKGKRDKKSNFVDMVQHMDKIVGKIVMVLEKNGVRNNTLILFTGDNGTHPSITSETSNGKVKGGKSKMTDAGTRVPLIANWPGKTPQGKVLDNLIDFSDVLPSFCQVADCSLPRDRIIDGQTFLPQIQGMEGKPREWVFCHYWEKGRNKNGTREFVRDKRWKLYDNGQMYDIKNDVLELSPMRRTDAEAMVARKRLQAAFEIIKENKI